MHSKVSIVIACHNDRRVLRLLASLARQSYPQHFTQIVVVENGSRVLQQEEFPLTVVYDQLPSPNMASARNRGVELSHGDYVLFTDADCVAHHEWVAESVNALSAGASAIGGVIRRYKPDTLPQRFGSNIVNGQHTVNYLPATDLPYVVGANSGFRRDKLVEVGGFDETLLSGNDVDVCYKLGLQGDSLTIAKRAIVFHDNRRDTWSHFKRFYNYSVYQVALFKKYQGHSKKLFVVNTYPWVLIYRVLRSFPRCCRLFLRGDRTMMWRSALRMVEAFGVICGDVHGAIKFKVPYI